MKYVLGLDLGITSIGWAVYNCELNNIHQCGVRLFDAAENPKDKSSLAEPRRTARGQRRRVRRRAYRMGKIKQLLIQNKIISELELEHLFARQEKGNPDLYDVYYLRYRALDHRLSNIELAQILIHLAKHRGFKSNRKKDKSVAGKINDSLQINNDLVSKYRSVGEMLYLNEKFGLKNTPHDYLLSRPYANSNLR
jgi:CRISPR-associated endonuclease Csn1